MEKGKTIYDHYMANPPIGVNAERKRGNTSQHAFWVGYDGGPMMGEPTSNARRAWRAGRDTRKEFEEIHEGFRTLEAKRKGYNIAADHKVTERLYRAGIGMATRLKSPILKEFCTQVRDRSIKGES